MSFVIGKLVKSDVSLSSSLLPTLCLRETTCTIQVAVITLYPGLIYLKKPWCPSTRDVGQRYCATVLGDQSNQRWLGFQFSVLFTAVYVNWLSLHDKSNFLLHNLHLFCKIKQFKLVSALLLPTSLTPPTALCSFSAILQDCTWGVR